MIMEESYIKKFEPLWDEWYVCEELGRGSYGCVYRAVNRLTKEECAIKEILVPNRERTLKDAKLEGMDEESAKKYFFRVVERTECEAKLMHQLAECKNIVQFKEEKIYDLNPFQEYGWGIYIRMELLVPLKEILLNKQFYLKDLLKLGKDLCNALHFCEQNRIIHQDIKPDNIFFDKENNVYKLGDFGIAQETGRATAKKGRPGTLSYMSPEVFQRSEVTHALDLYGLGMLLYRIMNQFRMPFLPKYPEPFSPEDRNNALMHRLNGYEVSEPNIQMKASFGIIIDESETECAHQIAKILQKSISADINNRYKSAYELKSVLETCEKLLVINNG